MASFRAIETVSDVLVRILQASCDSEEFGGQKVRFAVFNGGDYASNELTTGVSLFLYRTVVNGTHRTPPGRVRPNGSREKTMLPLDLHYLATVWAKTAAMEQRVAGWMMRTLEDAPILPSGVLHGARSGVFAPEETVEIMVNDLTNEDLFRIWDILEVPYRLSVPYLVRNVRVESRETVTAAEIVQERGFDFTDTGDA